METSGKKFPLRKTFNLRPEEGTETGPVNVEKWVFQVRGDSRRRDEWLVQFKDH